MDDFKNPEAGETTKDTMMQVDASSQNMEKVGSQSATQVLDAAGHLNRGLKERHVQFIAIGGTIGVGLFVGIGSALATGGPLSLFLGYILTSASIWAMVRSPSEYPPFFEPTWLLTITVRGRCKVLARWLRCCLCPA